MTITVTLSINEREYTHEWPARFEVCEECDGHGTVLTPSIREHAYSHEEFMEAFDTEELQEAYFKRGGMFDVQCPLCKGDRVVKVVDVGRVETLRHGKKLLNLWFKSVNKRLQAEAEYQEELDAERRMGC